MCALPTDVRLLATIEAVPDGIARSSSTKVAAGFVSERTETSSRSESAPASSLLHYHPDVRLIGFEATPAMLEAARARARTLGVSVDLRLGDAESLEFPDSLFDTVVFAYSLCSIPRPHRALAEARRVLRGGGFLLFTEHVRSPNAVVRAGQAILDPWFRWREADHLLREPLITVRRLGFNIVEVERTAFGVMERVHATKSR